MRTRYKENYLTEPLYRYNLSREDYNKLVAEHKGLCGICHKANPSLKRSLALDHNHKTMNVRGLLCYGCNRLLAAFDSPDLLRAILAYLKKYGENPLETAA